MPPSAIDTDLKRELAEEEAPLLQAEKDIEEGDSWDFDTSPQAVFLSQHAMVKVDRSGKVYEYDHEGLLGWSSMCFWSSTIFVHRCVRFVIPCVMLVALGTASLTFLLVPEPRHFRASSFNEFVIYIKYFIALILGLFVKTCYARWWQSVTTFKVYLTSIKQLVYSLRAIRVREEFIDEIQRLCVASCYVLHAEVHNMPVKSPDERYRRWQSSMQALVTRGLVKPQEQAELMKDYRQHAEQLMGVHSTMVWTWIGEIVGVLRSQPNVTPPMYVRLLFLCEDCLAKVEDLKTLLLVQIPFPYAHMLAALVHAANILMAVSVGMTLGSEIDEIVNGEGSPIKQQNPQLRKLYPAIQMCMMQGVFLCVQPLLYQAFLVLAHWLSYPYGDEYFNMPTETFIDHMQLDLRAMVVTEQENRKASALLLRKDGKEAQSNTSQ